MCIRRIAPLDLRSSFTVALLLVFTVVVLMCLELFPISKAISRALVQRSLANDSENHYHSTATTVGSPSAAMNTLSGRPFVLAHMYWEQLTSASRNLNHLQCWASRHNAAVVEPFVHQSSLYIPFPRDIYNSNKSLKFGELFDLEVWNTQSLAMGYSELVSWDKFLHDAPKQVILVLFEHSTRSKVEQRLRMGRRHPEMHLAVFNKSGCSGLTQMSYSRYLMKWNFHVVREVCFNFEYGDTITMNEFSEHIFGNYTPGNVTVVFYTWRGFSPGSKLSLTRILVSDSNCYSRMQDLVPPSPAVQRSAERYMDKLFGGEKYIAVIVRMEKTIGRFSKKNPDIVGKCFHLILQYVQRVKNASGIDLIFLSTDLDEFGSTTMKTKLSDKISMEFKWFRERLYGSFSVSPTWEIPFNQIAKSRDNGYIAMLQAWMVVRANYAIFSGGGSFQRRTLRLFENVHSKANDRSYEIVTECTSPDFV